MSVRSSRSRARKSAASRQTRARSPVRIPIRKESLLRRFGYSADASATARHDALKRAVYKYGALSVFRKLNALAVLNKNRQPALARKFRQDRDWVKREMMPN